MSSADALPSLAIDGERSLGVRLGERYSLEWMRPVSSPRLAVGRLARAASMFAGLAGRPQSVRRAFGDSSPAPTGRVERLPVELPPSPHLSAWWRLAASERFDGTLPRRGLPRAVGRSMRSPAGEETGPTGFTRRMSNAELPIRRSPDVAAVGPMFGSRESRRAPRRAAPRPSESAEGETPSPPVRRTDVLRAAVVAQRTHASAVAPPPVRPSVRRSPPLAGPAGVAPRRAEPSASRAPFPRAAGAVAAVSAHRAETPRLTDAFAAEASVALDRLGAPGQAQFGDVAQRARPQPAGNVASPGAAGPVGEAPAEPSAAAASAPTVDAVPSSSVITGAVQRTTIAPPAPQPFDAGVMPSTQRASPPTATEPPQLEAPSTSAQPDDALPLTVSTGLPFAAIGAPRELQPGPGRHIRRSLAPSVEQTTGAESERRRGNGSEGSLHEGPPSIAAAVSGTRLPTTLLRHPSAFPTVPLRSHRRVSPREVAVDLVTRPTPPRWLGGARHDSVATAAPTQPPPPSAVKSGLGQRTRAGGLLRTSLLGQGSEAPPASAGRSDRGYGRSFPVAAAVSAAALPSAVVHRQPAGAPAVGSGSRNPDRRGVRSAAELATRPPPLRWLGPARHGAVLTAATSQSALRRAVTGGLALSGPISAPVPGQFLRAAVPVERAGSPAGAHGSDRAADIARAARPLVTAVARSTALQAAINRQAQPTTASSRTLPPGLLHDAGSAARHLEAGTPTTRARRASVGSPTVASVGARGGIDEVFAHATGGLIRTLQPPEPALLGARTGADAVSSTHLPPIRRSAEGSTPGRSPAAVSPAPRPSGVASAPTHVLPGEAPAPPRAARLVDSPAGRDGAVPSAEVAPATTGPALAAPHLARRIVGRLGDGAAPVATRVGFERRPSPSLAGGADGLQVGSIRLPSASRAVAPAVIWRKAERVERIGMSNDRGGAGRASEALPPGSGDLLQRARALFSAAAVPPARPSLSAGVAGGLSSRPPDPHHPRPGDPPVVLRRFTGPSVAGTPGGPPVDASQASAEQSPAVISAETIEWIIEAVEERVLEELERRGLRHNPGVF